MKENYSDPKQQDESQRWDEGGACLGLMGVGRPCFQRNNCLLRRCGGWGDTDVARLMLGGH